MKDRSFGVFVLLLTCFFGTSCNDDEEDENPPASSTILYFQDGREVRDGDPFPIAVDMNSDDIVDFSIFVQLSADTEGDHLWCGINPIGVNYIKSGPADDSNFNNMGFLISEPIAAIINENLADDQEWTTDYSCLVVRHTSSQGQISYEGDWGSGLPSLVGIKLQMEGNNHFGWLRIHFDKTSETLKLVDYAFESVSNKPIKAGNR